MTNNNLTSRVLIGGLIVFLGIGFLIDQLFNVNFGAIFSKSWPLILVLLGVIVIIRNGRQYFVGGILLITGVVMEISILAGGRINLWDLWPLILIFLGFSMIFNRNYGKNYKSEDSADKIESVVMFWGEDKKLSSKNFSGGNITAIFGGVKLDLRECELAKDETVINITGLFGGIEVIAPEKCNVVIKGLGILGGFENRKKDTDTEKLPKLIIDGTAIFAGVEIS